MQNCSPHDSPGQPGAIDVRPQRPARPKPPDTGRIPRELFDSQWIVWRYQWDAPRWAKVPFQPRCPGRKAKVDCSTTWGSIDQALAAYEGGSFDGLGRVFSPCDGFFGVDLDRCLRDGKLMEWAEPFVAMLRGTYCEASVSGSGLHYIGRGKLPGKGIRRGGFGPDGAGVVEVYDSLRYFAFTGDARCTSGIADKQRAVDELYAAIGGPARPKPANSKPPRTPPTPAPSNGVPPDHDDHGVLDVALRSPRLAKLFDGDASGYASTSEADLALCSMLAFYCGPGRHDQVTQLFMQSKLGERAKAGREDYVRDTVAKAYQNKSDFWSPRGNGDGRGKGRKPDPDRPASGYILGRTGDPTSCVSNSVTWLVREKPAGFVRYDSFRQAILLDGRPLTDQEVIALTLQIEGAMQVSWPQEHVRSALIHLAHRAAFSSLTRYLESLAWDGIPRVDEFFVVCYGSEDSPYTREVGRILFLGATARAFRPGCQCDVMPVLIGGQGVGKSTGIAALCDDPDWFADDLGSDLFSGRAGEGLQGKWIFEFGEFARINRSTSDVVKSFLSRRVDRYRVPWGRMAQDFPRSCVFVGSTNDEQPLQDLENRRYLPIKVRQASLPAIREARDQLWAEAVHRYKAGEPWHTTSSHLVAEIASHLENARSQDAWETILHEKLTGCLETTTLDCARVLGLWDETATPPVNRLGKSEQTRIGIALRKLGFARDREKKGPRGYFYVRPTSMVEP